MSKKISKERKIRLTAKERYQLLKSPNHRERCILLKNGGMTHKMVAKDLEVSISSVSNWVKIYKERGSYGLWHTLYHGRVSKLSPKQIEELEIKSKKNPFNTVSETADYIKKEFGIKYNVRYLPRLLRKTECRVKTLKKKENNFLWQ